MKSLRAGRASLVDGFAEVHEGEVWLHGVHIPEYTQGTWTNHAARRKRKLLLNRHEIDRIEHRASTRRASPSSPCRCTSRTAARRWRSRLARGKKTWDKRHAIAERQAKRETEQVDRPTAQGHVVTLTDAEVPAWAAQPRASRACTTCTCTSCRRPSWRRSGRSSTPRGPAHRSAVAHHLPRERRGAGRSAAGARRTTVLRAALRAQAGHRGVPQRLGARLRRAGPGVPPLGDVLPRALRGGLRRATPSTRTSRSSRCTCRWVTSTFATRTSTRCGASSPTPARPVVVLHAGSGPVPNSHTGPAPVRGGARAAPAAHRGHRAHGRPGVPSSSSSLPSASSGCTSTRPWRSPASSRTWRRSRPTCRARLADLGDKVLLGSDFPNIPYPFAHQLETLERLGMGKEWLRKVCWGNAAALVG